MMIYGNLRLPVLRELQHQRSLEKQGVDVSGDEYPKHRIEMDALPAAAHVRELVPSKPLLTLQMSGSLGNAKSVSAMVYALFLTFFDESPTYTPPTGVGISLAIIERHDLTGIPFERSTFLIGAIYNALPRPRSLYWTSVLKYARQGLDI